MAKTLKTEESITIARPVAEVFDYMSNPENAPAWNSNLVDYAQESGKPDEVGSVMSLTAKVAGLRLEATEELTDYQANKHLGFRSKKSKVGYERELDFAADGAGTRVTWLSEAEAGTGLFKFADPIVQKLHSHDVRGSLAKAKTILES
ncbi:SRPBCC family protein [Rhodococcus daqingensis]|uniref:SRPBCC family protein n=1 Tax=Rhodococcus daqingensis TaxID=2479363 RepID=A0ABW2RWU4_9NOCA